MRVHVASERLHLKWAAREIERAVVYAIHVSIWIPAEALEFKLEGKYKYAHLQIGYSVCLSLIIHLSSKQHFEPLQRHLNVYCQRVLPWRIRRRHHPQF